MFGPKQVVWQRMQFSDLDKTPSDSSSEGESGSSLPEKRRSKRKGKKHSHMLIKPVAPKSYDRSPDTKLFHKFIQEAMNYVRKVAYNPEEWTMQEFFQDLFDYCFPVNFLGLKWKNFNCCCQGNRTVQEFVYKLNELCLTVGDIDDCARVNQLWFGCCTDI